MSEKIEDTLLLVVFVLLVLSIVAIFVVCGIAFYEYYQLVVMQDNLRTLIEVIYG